MKKTKLTAILLGFLASATLVGCGGQSAEERRAEERATLEEVIQYVPLLVDRGNQTKYLSTSHPNFPTENGYHLRDGYDINAVISGKRKGKDFSVSWSFREDEALAGFQIGEPTGDDATSIVIAPLFEEYDPVWLQSGNEDVSKRPKPRAGRLYGTVTVGETSERLIYDFYVYPQWRVEWLDLVEAKDAEADKLIGVRGYITQILTDWNSLSIADGLEGFNVFKVMDFQNDGFEEGDLISAVGKASAYNGLSQIQWVQKIKVENPADFPEVKEPAYNKLTAQDFYDYAKAANDEERLETKLAGKDSALIEIENLVMDHLTDRNNTVVEDVILGDHTNIILIGEAVDKNGEPTTVEIVCGLNYHMGKELQTQFNEFFHANKGKTVNYKGVLSWYTTPNLGPLEPSSFTVVG